ncbi:MAG: HEAT repeat domain-containing protein [Gemmataceae bacterium]|nr:HEAT repeat domain-containing protein [Gemmataceae bacterium]
MRFLLSILVWTAMAVRGLHGADPILDGKPLSAWLDSLKSDDLAERRGAANVLSQKLTLDARDAAAPLAQALKDPDRKVRLAVSKSIYRLGQDGQRAAVEMLLNEILQKDNADKVVSARALAHLGTVARPAGAQLVQFLEQRTHERNVQAACVRALCAMEPKIGRTFLDPAINALKDSDVSVRVDCAEALGEIGPQGMSRSLPALTVTLKDSAPEVRIAAARAVVKIDRREVAKCVAPLVSVLKDPAVPAPVRTAAAECLGEFGPAARPGIDQLKAGVKDSDPEVRHAAAVALFLLDGKNASAVVVPILAADMKDNAAAVRQSAANALRQLGPEAKAAVPALLASLKSDGGNFAVYSLVLDTIARVGEPAVPGLTDLLNDPATDPALTRAALEAVIKIGKSAGTAAPAIVAILRDRRKALLHKSAVQALAKMGPAGFAAVRPLLADADARMRLLGVQTAAELGSDAKPALTELKNLAKSDSDEAVRQAAGQAVKKVDPFGTP